MTDKISALTELTSPASDDVYPIVDVSDVSEGASGKLKKIRHDNLIANLVQRAEYVGAQFDKTNTTLANVTDLSLALVAGGTYIFKAVLHISADATGGHKYAMAGTATATSIVYQINAIRNDTAALVITSRETALGGDAGAAGGTSIQTEIVGTIVVNGAGTLTVQFAQNAANGTSSVLVGSSLYVERVP